MSYHWNTAQNLVVWVLLVWHLVGFIIRHFVHQARSEAESGADSTVAYTAGHVAWVDAVCTDTKTANEADLVVVAVMVGTVARTGCSGQ